MKIVLEDALNVFSYKLKPFLEEDKERFLQNFWRKSLKLPTIDTKIDEERITNYTKLLLKLFSNSTSDGKLEFMGIPLQARLLAEAFQEDFERFYYSIEHEPKLPKNLDIFDLYQRFIDSKYAIYFKEKAKVDNHLSSGLKISLTKALTRAHQRLSFSVMFSEQEKIFFGDKEEISFSEDELKLVGIIQFKDNEICFMYTSKFWREERRIFCCRFFS